MRAAIKASDVPVQWDSDVAKPPQIDDDVIRFNGVGDDGYETMYVQRCPELEPWDKQDSVDKHYFCKTDGRPYNELTIEVLKICMGVCPGHFTDLDFE